MASRGSAALVGAVVWLALTLPASAQFWPFSSSNSKPATEAPRAAPAASPGDREPATAPQAKTESVPLPRPAPQAAAARHPGEASPPADLAATGAVPEKQTAAESRSAAAPGAPAAPAGATTALDQNQRDLVNRFSLYLSSIQTLQGDFTQIAPDGSKSQGQFFIQKPGRVRFEYNPPSPLDIVADGRLVAVRNRSLDTQDLFPLSQTPLRFLLNEHIDLLRETNVVGVSSDDVFDTIIIEERQPLTGTSRLMMMFDAKTLQLKQWTVTDAQGYDTTVAVYNLDFTSKPDPSIFTINTARQN